MLDLLAAARQPFTSAEARALGVERNALTQLLRAGRIRRIGHGAFVATEVWAGATPERRHLLVSRAVVRRYRAVALSHVSAVVAHRLPVYGIDLALVHLTRARGAGRCGRVGRHPPVQVHPPLPPEAYTTVDDVPVCSEAMAVLAGGASESPGETLTLLLLAIGVGEVVQQAGIAVVGGGVARVDFLLPESGAVVEFDGAVKYEGADGREALVREKRREGAIRAAGHPVVRLSWPDLERPTRARALLMAAGWRATS